MISAPTENGKKVLTMDEYIRKDDILQMIESDSMWNLSFGVLYDDIQNMPHADVAPVRHGRWISLTECANEGVYCSICKKKVWKSDYALCSHKSRNKRRSGYCPNCGAKMDLE